MILGGHHHHPPPPHHHHQQQQQQSQHQHHRNSGGQVSSHHRHHHPHHGTGQQQQQHTAAAGTGNTTANGFQPPVEMEVPKEMVDFYLKSGKAIVICEAEKRTRSDVWKYFGRVKCLADGKFCKDVVACVGCNMVYLYRSKSQGTSTLRHHKCPYVFQVLGKDLFRSQQQQQSSQHHYQEYSNCPQGDGREMTPEGEDRKHVIPTPPPLKEHVMNSPPPQSAHPVAMHSGGVGAGGAGGLGGGRGSGAGALSTPPPPPPPPTQKEFSPQQLLCVRWGNYDSNIVSMFSKLRNQEQFVDLTLWCEGRTIKCHKMILSACSTYFEQLLTETQNLHPIIFLKDMRFWEIQALVEFMYKGEVSIHQDKLQSLLRAAESLQIKGLGSPSNDMAGGGSNNSSVNDDDVSNSTVDMSASATPSHHHQQQQQHHHHRSSSNSNLNNNNNNSSNNNNNNSSFMSSSQNNSMTVNMGMDLSNHGSTGGLNCNSSSGSSQSVGGGGGGGGGGGPAKRRKKETPRRIDIPRALNHPLQNYNSPMQSDDMIDDEDAGSDDSMTAHERNNMDLDGMKTENQSDMNYDGSDAEDGENYGDNDPGSQSVGEDSNDQTVDVDDEMESGALSLRISSSDRDRERSRKGNPIKKIQLGNNNNNDTTGGGQTLLHHTASSGN